MKPTPQSRQYQVEIRDLKTDLVTLKKELTAIKRGHVGAKRQHQAEVHDSTRRFRSAEREAIRGRRRVSDRLQKILTRIAILEGRLN